MPVGYSTARLVADRCGKVQQDWGSSMRAFSAIVLVLSMVTGLAGSAAARSVKDPIDVVVTSGFDRPESAVHDTKNDVYLVSNITGGPTDRDNTGFISKVGPDGTVIDARFIEGGVNGVTLNGPKGMAITKGVLHVADIDHVRFFDVDTGDPLGSIFFPDATFLNDVATNSRGDVYVSDIGFQTEPTFGESGADAVYRIAKSGEVTVLAAGNDLLHHPNGIHAFANGDVMVINFDPFGGFSDVSRIDRRGTVETVATLPTGLLDGIVRIKDGFLISSWVGFDTQAGSVVYYLTDDGDLSVVAENKFANYAADIGWDDRRQRLLVPQLPEPGDGGQFSILSIALP